MILHSHYLSFSSVSTEDQHLLPYQSDLLLSQQHVKFLNRLKHKAFQMVYCCPKQVMQLIKKERHIFHHTALWYIFCHKHLLKCPKTRLYKGFHFPFSVPAHQDNKYHCNYYQIHHYCIIEYKPKNSYNIIHICYICIYIQYIFRFGRIQNIQLVKKINVLFLIIILTFLYMTYKFYI